MSRPEQIDSAQAGNPGGKDEVLKGQVGGRAADIKAAAPTGLRNIKRAYFPEICSETGERRRNEGCRRIFSPLSTVVPSHLMDRDLVGFKDLKTDGVANPLGDIAFDEEPCSTPANTSGTIPLQSM